MDRPPRPGRPSYQAATITVRGEGLRPYSVNQIEGQRLYSGSDVVFTWLRRTRYGGDNFDLAVVPLNEEAEAYDIESSMDGGAVVRADKVTAPTFYSAASQVADFGAPRGLHDPPTQDSILYGRGQVRTATLSPLKRSEA